MRIICRRCGKQVVEEEEFVEYAESIFHTECIKERFREDNPGLEQEKYEKFDRMAEKVDKFELSGNLLIPVMYESCRQ